MGLLRPAMESDLTGLVALHEAEFPGFFLSRLGSDFLREYYRAVLDYDLGIALVATSAPEGLAGFVTGFVDPPRFYELLQARRARLAAAAMPAVVRAPALVLRLIQSARRIGTEQGAAGRMCEAELSSIAVASSARRQGLGRRLADAFARHADALQAPTVTLTTDADHNDAALRFYESLGFVRIETFTASGGRPMHRYYREFGESRYAA